MERERERKRLSERRFGWKGKEFYRRKGYIGNIMDEI
jgi:hypothetical protein